MTRSSARSGGPNDPHDPHDPHAAMRRNGLCGGKVARLSTIAAAACLLFVLNDARALPVGGQVVNGNVQIDAPNNGAQTINQTSSKGIVNWQGFSISPGEKLTILQPNSSAVLLNRVVGNQQSTIAGALTATGKVFLVNPNGVLFLAGPNGASVASINVGSIVASTLDISNADFLAGRYRFTGTPGSVENRAGIAVAPGGSAILLGGHVTNSGNITAKLGTVGMGAGSDISLDFAGDGLTTLHVNAAAAKAFIGNSGILEANGGNVQMTAQTAETLASTVINQQGIVRAQTLTQRDGHIMLDGGSNGVTQVSGVLDAKGGAGLAGGRIDVTGHQVALVDHAVVDASGDAGGGTVRIGGGARGRDADIANAQALWMGADTSVNASATGNGNGGHIVAYSVDATRIYGTLSVLGGASGGAGGLVETSGAYLDVGSANVQASAAHGAGGTWLLDPNDITIAASNQNENESGPVNNTVTFTASGTPSTVSAALINRELNDGVSVTVSTEGTGQQAGDIRVEADISKTQGKSATLTLDAADSIFMVPYAFSSPTSELSVTRYPSITSTSPDGHLNVVMNANMDNGNPGISQVMVGGDQNGTVQISTGGGDLSIGTTGPGGAFDGSAASLARAIIDTRATDGGSSGKVTIRGMNALGNGVTLQGVQIVTNDSDIDIRGIAEAPTSSEVELRALLLTPATLSGVYIGPYEGFSGDATIHAATTLQTGSGSISIFGFADNAGTEYAVTGVTLTGLTPTGFNEGTTLTTQTGGIDVRGVVNYTNAAANAAQVGADIEQTTFKSNGAGASPIMFSGVTNTADTGLNLNNVTLTAVDANLILRALNSGGANSSLAVANSKLSSSGVLVMTPGGVSASYDRTTQFTLTAADNVPINIFTGGTGMVITSTMLAQFGGFQTWVFGTDTHTGKITVGATSCTDGPAPSVCDTVFPTSVTLANPGKGSEGITALYGLTLTGHTLVLSSAGTVSVGGPITANALLLAGPSTFTLTNASNSVNVLAAADAGNVDYVNAGGFIVGSMISPTYDTATNSVTTLDASNSSALNDFTAQALTGGITLGGGTAQAGGPTGQTNVNVHAGDNLDLVMEKGEFVNAGTGTLGTGDAWHIWALTWEGETRGGIEPGNALPNFYGCTFGAGCTWGGVVPLATNHFVYVNQPSVTVTVDDKARAVGAQNPTFTSTTGSLINGDDPATVSGTLSSTADANSPAGEYPITGSYTSSIGYQVKVVPGKLTVTAPTVRTGGGDTGGGSNGDTVSGGSGGTVVVRTATPVPSGLFPESGLQTFFSDRERSFVYENNMGGLNVCVGSNTPIASLLQGEGTADQLAIEWKRVRTQPNLNNCIVINSQHGCGDF